MMAMDAGIIALLASILSVIVAVWNVSRAGSWRNSDELRNIDKRQSNVEGRLSVVEKQVDFEFAHLRKQLDGIAAAVSRMESFFMRPPNN